MKTTKSYWYVMVINRMNGKCRFVTRINNRERVCNWNDNEKPLLLTRSSAIDLVYGLRINGYDAYAVCHPVLIEEQNSEYIIND